MKAKKKLTDVLALNLKEFGIKSVYGVQGGAVVHIFDSIHESTDIEICYNHHEQASSLAAVANSKINQNISVCVVTTGPATTNALTGLLSAWQDSIPVLFISGQTRKEQTSYGKKVRQRGSQECNILDIVKPWTKAQFLVDENSDFDSDIRKALSITLEPRMGPVWIDIPVNLQWSQILYSPSPIKLDEINNKNLPSIQNKINVLSSKLKNSTKPIFILGRQTCPNKSINNFLDFITQNKIPIVTTWGSAGIVGDKANNIGIIGVSGQQAANLAVRASDLVIILGSHFSVTQSGNNYKAISKSQEFYYINIDSNELENLFINNKSSKIILDCNSFFENIVKYPDLNKEIKIKWNNFLNDISEDLSPLNCYKKIDVKGFANPHEYICKLYSELSTNDLVVVDGGGCALYAGFQCLPKKAKFKIICSTAISAMGTGLPELVGVSSRGSHKRYICIIGDGSLMFNLQELQTLKTNCPPCLIIVINNDGYLAIRHTQSQFLGRRFYGTSSYKNGIEIPLIKDIAKTFNFDYMVLDAKSNFDNIFEKSINYKKHTILEIIASPSHGNLFTASFTKNRDGSFTPNDIHKMIPFEDYDYKVKAKRHEIDLET